MGIPELENLSEVLSNATEIHRSTCGDWVASLIFEVENAYGRELDVVLQFLVDDPRIVGIAAPCGDVLKEFLLGGCRGGAEVCNLGPPLQIHPPGDFPVAVVAHAAMGMADDGMTGRRRIPPAECRTFYGYLLEEGFQQREAGALNSMLAAAIVNSAVQRLNEIKARESAATMLRLSCQVFGGMVAASFPSQPPAGELCRRDTCHGFIAREMLLDQIFLRSAPADIRSRLLGLGARLFEIRKVVEDIVRRPRGNLVIPGILGVNRREAIAHAEAMITGLWSDSSMLTPDLRNVMALRMVGCLRMVIEEAKR